MTWMEEVSYQYRDNEYLFVDLPAIFQYCFPTLFREFLRLALLQIAINIVYQLIRTETLFSGRHPAKHILSSTLGSLVLVYFYPAQSVAFLVAILILLYLIIIDKKLIFFVLSSIVATGWFSGVFDIELRPLQGPIMIAAMKVVYIVMGNNQKKGFGLPLFLHYILCPSSTVFGPIVPFDTFKSLLQQPRFSLHLRPTLNAITATFLTFITANCICQSVEWVSTSEELEPYHIRFLRAYKHALEFRMSHYFICYLSTFQMRLGVPLFSTKVVNFWAIEAPRSMKTVVRSWNEPMHHFLKNCVYLKIRTVLGASFAVVLTFLISAGLHMFEMRVTVVLFGLAIVTVIESRLESHLPRALADPWMRITTFIHLVFFGCIMMGYEEDQEKSYFHFVMERWLELSFISFKILIVECVLCVLFELKRLCTRPSNVQK